MKSISEIVRSSANIYTIHWASVEIQMHRSWFPEVPASLPSIKLNLATFLTVSAAIGIVSKSILETLAGFIMFAMP